MFVQNSIKLSSPLVNYSKTAVKQEASSEPKESFTRGIEREIFPRLDALKHAIPGLGLVTNLRNQGAHLGDVGNAMAASGAAANVIGTGLLVAGLLSGDAGLLPAGAGMLVYSAIAGNLTSVKG